MNAVKQERQGGDRLIRASMTVVVVAVALVAAWVSYWHAVAVIQRYGAEDELSAHLVPATVDGMIYASSMVLLWCARYRLPVPALARWALALGVAATLAANILHGIERGPVAAALAAWPAIALVISYELIMWVVRSGRELADRAHEERPEQETTAPAPVGAPLPVAPAEPVDAAAVAAQEEGDRRARAAALLAQDPTMSGAALARALGVHETTGRKYRREALNGSGSTA